MAGVSVCVCSEGWSLAQEHGPGVHSATGRVRHVCELARTESHVEDVATLAGLGIGLSVLALFICFTLRLFSKARNVEARLLDVLMFFFSSENKLGFGSSAWVHPVSDSVINNLSPGPPLARQNANKREY